MYRRRSTKISTDGIPKGEDDQHDMHTPIWWPNANEGQNCVHRNNRCCVHPVSCVADVGTSTSKTAEIASHFYWPARRGGGSSHPPLVQQVTGDSVFAWLVPHHKCCRARPFIKNVILIWLIFYTILGEVSTFIVLVLSPENFHRRLLGDFFSCFGHSFLFNGHNYAVVFVCWMAWLGCI